MSNTSKAEALLCLSAVAGYVFQGCANWRLLANLWGSVRRKPNPGEQLHLPLNHLDLHLFYICPSRCNSPHLRVAGLWPC